MMSFVDRVFVKTNLTGFTGDPRFIQNDYAKRAFSKWRSSIADVYAWRAANVPAERERMQAEAELASRQAWALCPYSADAAGGYVKLLLNKRQSADALAVAKTAFSTMPPDERPNAEKQLKRVLELAEDGTKSK